jgi:hypothetical protein
VTRMDRGGIASLIPDLRSHSMEDKSPVMLFLSVRGIWLVVSNVRKRHDGWGSATEDAASRPAGSLGTSHDRIKKELVDERAIGIDSWILTQRCGRECEE